MVPWARNQRYLHLDHAVLSRNRKLRQRWQRAYDLNLRPSGYEPEVPCPSYFRTLLNCYLCAACGWTGFEHTQYLFDFSAISIIACQMRAPLTGVEEGPTVHRSGLLSL